MERKHSLNALAVGNSADGECFVKSTAFAANHDASEYLDSFLVPFHNPGMNAHAVAHGKLRRVAFLLFFLDASMIRFIKLLSLPRRSLDEGGLAHPPAGRANIVIRAKEDCKLKIGQDIFGSDRLVYGNLLICS
jgi:hypothetical protein